MCRRGTARNDTAVGLRCVRMNVRAAAATLAALLALTFIAAAPADAKVNKGPHPCRTAQRP